MLQSCIIIVNTILLVLFLGVSFIRHCSAGRAVIGGIPGETGGGAATAAAAPSHGHSTATMGRQVRGVIQLFFDAYHTRAEDNAERRRKKYQKSLLVISL
ncbi:hypothetical protein Zmor_019552 [Zophobas morio]|uniref:Uncharacterized protein n=1 Tax=Zophobas morio TaxID=2755281 RepID=A0AA38I1S1_9CUCU|nr:hypothetical protein Zmor_019552 [Zophobas morio]